MYSFLHKKLQLILGKSRIDIHYFFHTDWYRDLTAFRKVISSVRRQNHDDGVDKTDLGMLQD